MTSTLAPRPSSSHSALRRAGLGLILVLGSCATSQAGAGSDELFDVAADNARRGGERQSYLVTRALAPLVIDGVPDEESWRLAASTAAFVDIQGDRQPRPELETTAKLLWDERYLYIAAELEQPDLWATLTERDAVIFHDDDFEVFIDPDSDTRLYWEFEINALGTVWDLLLVRPYRDNGPPLNAFDTPGLESAVALGGSLNDARDRDSGWSVELAIPWAAMAPLTRGACPPADGDTWSLNFSRVEWHLDALPGGGYAKRADAAGQPLPEENWVWSPQGEINMHVPESWGRVQFRDVPVSEARGLELTPEPGFSTRLLLRGVKRAERAFFLREGHYTTDPRELGLAPRLGQALRIWRTPSGFEAELPGPEVEGRPSWLWIRADGSSGVRLAPGGGGSQ